MLNEWCVCVCTVHAMICGRINIWLAYKQYYKQVTNETNQQRTLRNMALEKQNHLLLMLNSVQYINVLLSDSGTKNPLDSNGYYFSTIGVECDKAFLVWRMIH